MLTQPSAINPCWGTFRVGSTTERPLQARFSVDQAVDQTQFTIRRLSQPEIDLKLGSLISDHFSMEIGSSSDPSSENLLFHNTTSSSLSLF